VRSDQQAGDEIAKHDRLPKALEDDRGDRRHAEDDREIGEEDVGVVLHLPGTVRDAGIAR